MHALLPAQSTPSQAVSQAARARRARGAAWRVGVGAFAGFVLALDIVLACLVEQLLKASPPDDLMVSGVLHSGWSPTRGAFFDLGAGGLAIFASCVVLGAACGWALAARRANDGTAVGVERG